MSFRQDNPSRPFSSTNTSPLAFESSIQGLRLLSIDGGGIKGYMALLILQRIFRAFPDTRPYQVFDLIGGTSTGGLIAIMLGRLGMSIEECLKAYEELSKQIFRKRPGVMRKTVAAVWGSKWYNTTHLQNAIKTVLEQQGRQDGLFAGEGKDALFYDDTCPGSCKVMLCVTRKTTNEPEVLRSYKTTTASQNEYLCRIWEAGSATAAAPFYFKSVKFETGEEWCDGGMHRNNPVVEVLNEARRIWPTNAIACLLSVGCGVGDVNRMPHSIIGFSRGAIDMLTDAEAIRKSFDASYDGRSLRSQGSYFRFSVERGAARMELDHWDKAHLKALADKYLGDALIGDKVEECLRRLLRAETTRDFVPLPARPRSHPPRKGQTGFELQNAALEPVDSGAGVQAPGSPAADLTDDNTPPALGIEFSQDHGQSLTLGWNMMRLVLEVILEMGKGSDGRRQAEKLFSELGLRPEAGPLASLESIDRRTIWGAAQQLEGQLYRSLAQQRGATTVGFAKIGAIACVLGYKRVCDRIQYREAAIMLRDMADKRMWDMWELPNDGARLMAMLDDECIKGPGDVLSLLEKASDAQSALLRIADDAR